MCIAPGTNHVYAASSLIQACKLYFPLHALWQGINLRRQCTLFTPWFTLSLNKAELTGTRQCSAVSTLALSTLQFAHLRFCACGPELCAVGIVQSMLQLFSGLTLAARFWLQPSGAFIVVDQCPMFI